MAARKNQDDVVLATKYTTQYMSHVKSAIKTNYSGNGTKSMKLSLEGSLVKI